MFWGVTSFKKKKEFLGNYKPNNTQNMYYVYSFIGQIARGGVLHF